MSKTKISDGNGPYCGEKNPDPSGTRTEVGHAGMGVPVGGGGPVGALDWRDVVCSIVWVGMLTVAFWRGTWNVLALYVFPRSNIVHAVVCYAVGSVTRTALSVAAPSLHAYVTGATLARQVSVTSPHADVTGAPGARRVSVPSPHAYATGATLARQVSVTSPHADVTGAPRARRVSVPSPHAYVTGATLARQVSVPSPHADVTGAPRVRRMAVTSLYNYAFCVATVAHWRGLWKLLDTFVPLSWTWSLVLAFVGFVGLALLRSSRMAVPPPMAVGIDTRDDYFVPLPRFRSTWRTPWRYFLDHVFSRAVIDSLVVTAWRGIWNFYSDVIFPRDSLVSSVVNLLGAIALVVGLLLAERPAGRLARHLAINGQRVVRLTFESAYILLALAAVVGYWRGWWLLLEKNILPQAVLGPWLCHAIGYVALALTIASDSLTPRSVILNGETNSEVHWPIAYMSILLKRKTTVHPQDKVSVISCAHGTLTV